jgi:cardiolipin synthase
MNIADPRFFKQDAGVGEWVDAMVRIEGPAAWALEAVSLSLTFLQTGGDFRAAAGTADPFADRQQPASRSFRPARRLRPGTSRRCC